MNNTLIPASLEELVAGVRSIPRVIPVGRRTKPRMSQVEATRIEMTRLSGIVEYNPSEFTITALAGTSLQEVVQTLAAQGQYLPFWPVLVESGATLGGTIASGLNGPGRFRFGGLRDFILAVQLVDGAGRVLRMGGKVVKNAAGFDLPRFLVGSLGRFAILTEATFKVFPLTESSLTIQLEPATLPETIQILIKAGNSRWELEALDVLPGDRSILMRLGGPSSAIPALAEEILSLWKGCCLPEKQAATCWSELQEFRWSMPDQVLVKVPLAIGQVLEFCQSLERIPGSQAHLSGGGNLAYVSLPLAGFLQLDSALQSQKLSGVTLRGQAPLWAGTQTSFKIASAVKTALDAETRFPGLNE
jgi:glycolate oxidase FAD binding subunit